MRVGETDLSGRMNESPFHFLKFKNSNFIESFKSEPHRRGGFHDGTLVYLQKDVL